MSFSNASREKLSRPLVLLDIDADSFGVAVVRLGGTPAILFSERLEVFTPLALDRTLARLAEHAASALPGVRPHVLCTLGPAHYRFSVGRAHVQYASPRVLTPELFGQVLAEKSVENFVYRSHDRPVEHHIMHLVLNGYPAHSYEGLSAREIEIAAYEAYAEEDFLAEVKRSVAAAFHTASFEIRTSVFLGTTILRDILNLQNGFLYVDVRGEETQVSLVGSDGVLGSHLFHSGLHGLVRQVAAEMGTIPEEAAALLALHAQGAANQDAVLRVQEALSALEHEWQPLFLSAVEKFAKGGLLPEKVVFSPGGALVNVLAQSPGGLDAMRFVSSGRPFEGIVADTEFLSRFCPVAPQKNTDSRLLLQMLWVLHRTTNLYE